MKANPLISAVLVALVAALLPTAALAGPGPWYLWKSRVDGKTFCAQASPGPGWFRDGGPFKSARCA